MIEKWPEKSPDIKIPAGTEKTPPSSGPQGYSYSTAQQKGFAQGVFKLNSLTDECRKGEQRWFISHAELEDNLGAIAHDGTGITYTSGSAFDFLSEGDHHQIKILFEVSNGLGETENRQALLQVTGSRFGPIIREIRERDVEKGNSKINGGRKSGGRPFHISGHTSDFRFKVGYRFQKAMSASGTFTYKNFSRTSGPEGKENFSQNSFW